MIASSCDEESHIYRQYSVIHDPNEMVARLKQKAYEILPRVYNPLGNPLDYCIPFISFRVARWIFIPICDDISPFDFEFMLDLARLDEDMYHLVATIRVKELIHPQAQKILDQFDREEAFFLSIPPKVEYPLGSKRKIIPLRISPCVPNSRFSTTRVPLKTSTYPPIPFLHIYLTSNKFHLL
jgi:hypothetical protein